MDALFSRYVNEPDTEYCILEALRAAEVSGRMIQTNEPELEGLSVYEPSPSAVKPTLLESDMSNSESAVVFC